MRKLGPFSELCQSPTFSFSYLGFMCGWLVSTLVDFLKLKRNFVGLGFSFVAFQIVSEIDCGVKGTLIFINQEEGRKPLYGRK